MEINRGLVSKASSFKMLCKTGYLSQHNKIMDKISQSQQIGYPLALVNLHGSTKSIRKWKKITHYYPLIRLQRK